MKNKYILYLVFLLSLFLSSCQRMRCFLEMRNNTDYCITIVYTANISLDYHKPYPDTIPPFSVNHYNNIREHKDNFIYEGWDEDELLERYDRRGTDTFCIFVFRYDVFQSYNHSPYDYSNVPILQRYDLSKEEAERFRYRKDGSNPTLTFPPSEEMKTIKMWPPYGTYDKDGNRIEKN